MQPNLSLDETASAAVPLYVCAKSNTDMPCVALLNSSVVMCLITLWMVELAATLLVLDLL